VNAVFEQAVRLTANQHHGFPLLCHGRQISTIGGLPLGLPVLLVDSSCTHAIATTPVGRPSFVAQCSTSGGLPHRFARSAPALRFSGPAQLSLTLWPACSLTPLRSRIQECFGPSRYLLEPLQVLPVGATSYRAGFAPARINTPFTAHKPTRATLGRSLYPVTHLSLGMVSFSLWLLFVLRHRNALRPLGFVLKPVRGKPAVVARVAVSCKVIERRVRARPEGRGKALVSAT
jgi:hypothetical protein